LLRPFDPVRANEAAVPLSLPSRWTNSAQPNETLLITRRRGFGKTNLYFLPRPENISGHERIEASALDRKNLPTKYTQLKGSTQKNKRNTQWTEQEREAYFQKFAEENAEHLAVFLHADNHGSKKGG
jgi:hypothetical protein